MHHRFKCKLLICATLGRNHGSDFCDLELGKDFLHMTPKAESLKTEIDKHLHQN